MDVVLQTFWRTKSRSRKFSRQDAAADPLQKTKNTCRNEKREKHEVVRRVCSFLAGFLCIFVFCNVFSVLQNFCKVSFIVFAFCRVSARVFSYNVEIFVFSHSAGCRRVTLLFCEPSSDPPEKNYSAPGEHANRDSQVARCLGSRTRNLSEV